MRERGEERAASWRPSEKGCVEKQEVIIGACSADETNEIREYIIDFYLW